MDKIKNILSGNKNDVATSDNTTGTTSGLTSGTTTGNQTGFTGEGSHFGNTRDPVGSGNTSDLTGQDTTGLGNTQNATGLGTTQNTQGTTTAGPHSSNLANKVDPRVDSDLDGSRIVEITGGVGNTSTGTGYGTSTGIGNTTTQSGNTGYSGTEAANRLDPSVNTSGGTGLETAYHHSATHGGGAEEADTHHGSHLGRDAAVGAGGVGLAEHEHRKHEQERGTGVGGPTGSTGLGSSTGAYDNTTGSTGRQSSHLGRDAAVGAGGVGLAEHEHHKHQNEQGTGIGGTTGTSTGAYGNTTGISTTGTGHQSHLGRDAGIGAAGAGLAEHEHSKNSAGTPSSLPGPAPNTAGPHSKDWLNKLDPRVNAHPDQPQSTGHGPLKVGEGNTGTASTTTAGPHSSSLANKADPSVDSDRSKDHHYGRDAAVTGGVGAAGYEAEKHHQKHDKDLTPAEREAKKEHKHELKEEKREHKESKGGVLSFLHRDKNKKYTPEEEAEFDRQEREHNSSHKGRDALGGAAVGGAAYEAEKHHRDHHNTSAEEGDTNKPLPTAPGNHGVDAGAGTQNALASDNTTSTSSGHHLSRDAALVGGAGVAGEHEHHKHAGTTGTTGATPLAEKPRGTDLGDKLHGVARNRGVPSPTGFPDSQGYGTGSSTTGTTGTTGTTSTTGQHHYGRDATAVGGAAALGEHEHRKHEHENVGSSGIGNQASGITGSTTGTGNQHHLGRDAAVGAGGVGLAEHEHRKHEGVTGSGYDNTASGLTGSNQGHSSHLGRDAAGLGAAGLVGDHEYKKHEAKNEDVASGRQYDNTTSTTGGLTGSHPGPEYLKDDLTTGQYSTTGQQSSLGGPESVPRSGYDSNTTGGIGGIGGVGGDRNRLHKDPAVDHPAAQGGVPGSGTERERMIGQCEQRLDQDTGVTNTPRQGGVNSASNY